ncbi:MAG: mannose-6-phosphate isomerase-like protein (cupin superfamily) [Arenicella sp.]|jgi:mannose-6-phosphate isomerase-like protein (cupin superfamily)
MKNTQKLTLEQLEHRIVRLNEMVACKTAFIDARTPGSDEKENFCLIGEGVTENPDQIIHIDIPHGFNIGAARQPQGCKNSHHSHDTEEVFMIHSGTWQFTWGENGEDGSIIIGEGDTISLPANMFRGFENVGQDNALMFSILGLNSNGTAGQVVWAPYVFEQAEDYGLVLLEDGRLIDTAAGAIVPVDGIVMAATTEADVKALDRLTAEDMTKCIASQTELESLNQGGHSGIDGVAEIAVIGVENENEGMAAGKMGWPHGFQLRRMHLEPGAVIDRHLRFEEEVVIVQQGSLDIICDDQSLTLSKGDLFSIPVASIRRFQNSSLKPVHLWVVRRGDKPISAQFTKP